ncbi:MAG: TIGR03545 family protein, partial [Thermodesulfobacteriota bacterium]|nr:TIGR03545 family protein [Thermodesulfobacteriota bacterium]
MKVIRWQGLVFFLIVVLVFSIVWFFLLDGFIERMIEKTGTKIVGAKVDLDNVDVSFFPMGFTFKRLQVTNPKKPMTNA